MENHNLSLTPLETQVLECLIDNLYAEPGFSDVDANDISKQTKIPTKTIRGVLSSLVKKGIVQLDENDSKFVIIYLMEQFWHLHPTWKNEI
jgi:predicted transcriptional regulator